MRVRVTIEGEGELADTLRRIVDAFPGAVLVPADGRIPGSLAAEWSEPTWPVPSLRAEPVPPCQPTYPPPGCWDVV